MTADNPPRPDPLDTSLLPLGYLLDSYSPDDVQKLLDTFTCNKNADVQRFLHRNAAANETIHKSRTYLVVTTSSIESSDSPLDIVGYFTLALKYVPLGDEVSNTTKKKLHGLSVPDGGVVGYLIGQLGKNDNSIESIQGSLLLKLAVDKIKQVKMQIGGRFVIVECDKEPKLISFYETNGFRHLQDDPSDTMAQFFCLL